MHSFSRKLGKQSEHTDRCPQLQNKTFGGFCKQTMHWSFLKVSRSLMLVSILESRMTRFRNPISSEYINSFKSCMGLSKGVSGKLSISL